MGVGVNRGIGSGENEYRIGDFKIKKDTISPGKVL
jgi:hypothetical protein